MQTSEGKLRQCTGNARGNPYRQNRVFHALVAGSHYEERRGLEVFAALVSEQAFLTGMSVLFVENGSFRVSSYLFRATAGLRGMGVIGSQPVLSQFLILASLNSTTYRSIVIVVVFSYCQKPYLLYVYRHVNVAKPNTRRILLGFLDRLIMGCAHIAGATCRMAGSKKKDLQTFGDCTFEPGWPVLAIEIETTQRESHVNDVQEDLRSRLPPPLRQPSVDICAMARTTRLVFLFLALTGTVAEHVGSENIILLPGTRRTYKNLGWAAKTRFCTCHSSKTGFSVEEPGFAS